MIARLIAVFVCLHGLFLHAGFDPGGVAFDFFDFDPLPASAEGENLVGNGSFEDADTNPLTWQNKKGGWVGYSHLHVSGEEDPGLPEFRIALKEGATQEAVDENPADGSRCLKLYTPESLRDLRNPLPMISNKATTDVDLPPSNSPVRYRVSFKLRGTDGQTFHIFGWDRTVREGEDAGGRGTALRKTFGVTSEWRVCQAEFTMPAGSEKANLCFQFYGCGVAYIDDVRMTPLEVSAPVDVRLVPFGFMDKLYYVGEGMPAQLNFAFDSKNESFRDQKLLLELDLPEGFRLVEACRTVPLLEERGETLVFSLERKMSDLSLFTDYYAWRAPSFIVESAEKASDKLHRAEYRIVGDGWRGPTRHFDFRVVPRVEGRRPKRFLTSGRPTNEFDMEGAGLDAAERLYRSAGFNALQGDGSFATRFTDMFRSGSFWALANGYRIGGRPHPPGVQFRDVDGKHVADATCPVEIYREGPFFRTRVLDMIRKAIAEDDLFDNVYANWEPYSYNSKGCFCDRCREEFVAYCDGEIDAGDIRASWPGDILRNYFDVWVKFRSWQHGRLVVALDRNVKALGGEAGKTSHFIPAISIHYTNGYSDYRKNSNQYFLDDYSGEISWLVPWGPYISTHAGQYYEYVPARHLPVYAIAEQTRRFVTASAPQLKIMGYPHAIQGSLRVTEPEAIAFEMLCFLLQKWEGATLYFFPRGYDYRYWSAIAAANSAIADIEDFIFDGEQCSELVEVEPRSGLPEIYHQRAWDESGDEMALVPGLSDYGIIQHKAFRLGESLLVAVGNFWQKGEHFFNLRVNGLRGERFNVSVPGVNCGDFSADQLRDGVLLQVGALRWQLVIISPDEKDGPVFSQEKMRELLDSRRTEIREALSWERREYDKRMTADSDDTLSRTLEELAPISSAGVTAKPEGEAVRVETGAYELVVEPGRGGGITGMTVNGERIVKKGMALAVPGFMAPAKPSLFHDTRMRVEGLEASKEGVTLRMSRRMERKDAMGLEGLKTLCTLTFSEKGFVARTELENTSDTEAMELSFRYHNMADFTEAAFADGAVFKRNFIVELFRRGAPMPEYERGKRVMETSATRVALKTHERKAEPEIAFPDSLRYVMFWDSANQPASTLEPVFDPIQLAPTGKAEYWMSFRCAE